MASSTRFVDEFYTTALFRPPAGRWGLSGSLRSEQRKRMEWSAEGTSRGERQPILEDRGVDMAEVRAEPKHAWPARSPTAAGDGTSARVVGGMRKQDVICVFGILVLEFGVTVDHRARCAVRHGVCAAASG
jgi:hypothetical protein